MKLSNKQLQSILKSDLFIDINDMSDKDLNTYKLDFKDYVKDDLIDGMSIVFDIFYTKDVRVIKGDRLTPDCEETLNTPTLEIDLKSVHSIEKDFLEFSPLKKKLIEDQIKKEAYLGD